MNIYFRRCLAAAVIGLAAALAMAEHEDGEAGPAGADQWFVAQRTFPSASVDIGQSHRAALAQAGQLSTGVSAAAAWQSLGPANIGGRVTDLAVDPTRTDTVYAGAATGGVWKSVDAGRTCVSAWNAALAPSIGALAITGSGVLYAGDGQRPDRRGKRRVPGGDEGTPGVDALPDATGGRTGVHGVGAGGVDREVGDPAADVGGPEALPGRGGADTGGQLARLCQGGAVGLSYVDRGGREGALRHEPLVGTCGARLAVLVLGHRQGGGEADDGGGQATTEVDIHVGLFSSGSASTAPGEPPPEGRVCAAGAGSGCARFVDDGREASSTGRRRAARARRARPRGQAGGEPVRDQGGALRRAGSRLGHRRHRRAGGSGHAQRRSRRVRAPHRRLGQLRRGAGRRGDRAYRL